MTTCGSGDAVTSLIQQGGPKNRGQTRKGNAMLRLDNIIRLTPREVDRFTVITGFTPADVKTLDDLDAYVDRCKRHYWGVSDDTRFLHWLIDKERSRCLGSL